MTHPVNAAKALERAVDNQARQREAAQTARRTEPTDEPGIERADEGEKQP